MKDIINHKKTNLVKDFLKYEFANKFQLSWIQPSGTVRHRQAPKTSVGQLRGLGLHFLFSEKLP